MRDIISGDILSNAAASRRLRKYAFGSEFITGLELHFRDGFNIEVGDKILLDLTSLQISDIQTGTRSGDSRIFEVNNIQKNLRTGKTTISIVDTQFDKTNRFGLIGPSSLVKDGISDTVFTIKESFGSQFGQNEFLKWNKFLDPAGVNNPVIQVRSKDYVTQGTAEISNITGNQPRS